MSKSKIFIGLTLGFASGILLGSRFQVPALFLYGAAGAAAAVLGVSFIAGRQRIALLAFLLFSVLGGMLRLDMSRLASEYQSQFGEKVEVEGIIAEDPDVRTDKQMLTVQPKNYAQRILVTTTLYADYAYGDWVVVNGKIKEPENFSGFDYRGYLERYNVYGLMQYPKVLVLKSHKGNPVKQALLGIKHAFIRHIQRVVREPESSLLLGILIGAKKSLPQDLTENFSLTGTSHIVAMSGFNITIIIAALGHFAKLLGRRASSWTSVFVIVGFVVISGASASVVRASFMGILLLIALNVGRQYSIIPAMFFSAFVMLLINPRILYWDIGFQLSFAATFGIVGFMPLLEELTEKWGSWFGLKATLFSTLAAIVATLPLTLFNFGRLSIVAPLVNVLVLPLLPLTMLLGFLSIVPYLGPGFAFVAGILLKYLIAVTGYFAHVPWSGTQVRISGVVLGVLYAVVLLLYAGLRHWASTRHRSLLKQA